MPLFISSLAIQCNDNEACDRNVQPVCREKPSDAGAYIMQCRPVLFYFSYHVIVLIKLKLILMFFLFF